MLGTGCPGQGSPGRGRGQKADPPASWSRPPPGGEGYPVRPGGFVPLTVMHGPSSSLSKFVAESSGAAAAPPHHHPQALGDARLRCKLTPFVLQNVLHFCVPHRAHYLAAAPPSPAHRLHCMGEGAGLGPWTVNWKAGGIWESFLGGSRPDTQQRHFCTSQPCGLQRVGVGGGNDLTSESLHWPPRQSDHWPNWSSALRKRHQDLFCHCG